MLHSKAHLLSRDRERPSMSKLRHRQGQSYGTNAEGGPQSCGVANPGSGCDTR